MGETKWRENEIKRKRERKREIKFDEGKENGKDEERKTRKLRQRS